MPCIRLRVTLHLCLYVVYADISSPHLCLHPPLTRSIDCSSKKETSSAASLSVNLFWVPFALTFFVSIPRQYKMPCHIIKHTADLLGQTQLTQHKKKKLTDRSVCLLLLFVFLRWMNGTRWASVQLLLQNSALEKGYFVRQFGSWIFGFFSNIWRFTISLFATLLTKIKYLSAIVLKLVKLSCKTPKSNYTWLILWYPSFQCSPKWMGLVPQVFKVWNYLSI